MCFGGWQKKKRAHFRAPSFSRPLEVQVQELGVASVPRRGLCTDADHGEHFSPLGKSCCLAAKIT